jgi:uncharacterized membrane protein YjjP (DUF1212 family)
VAKPKPAEKPRGDPAPNDAAWKLLQLAALLLVEYSVRAKMITRQLGRIAEHLGVRVTTSVGYREVTLHADNGTSCYVQAPELRLNAATNLRTWQTVDELCAGRIGTEEAIGRFEEISHAAPEYGRWVLALIFGVGASALAWLLRADPAAIIVSGVSSGLGLIARKELGKRHVIYFLLPFTAALIGALLGGIVILAGWTSTPGLCLVVPALMLVPGPHLILGVEDMLENHMQTGLSRLGLAAGMLVAAALGIGLGKWMMLGALSVNANPSSAVELTLPLDVVLAGVAALGFAAFYNSPRRVLWVSIMCGMIGHGARFVALQQGIGAGIATLMACLAVGVVARVAADRLRLPFGAVAFAGAVTMMPGVAMYESLAGAMQMSAAGASAPSQLVASSLALFVKAAFVVMAMAIGLLVGSRIGGLLNGRNLRS